MSKFSALRHHCTVLFLLPFALLVLLTMTVQGQTTSSYDGKRRLDWRQERQRVLIRSVALTTSISITAR